MRVLCLDSRRGSCRCSERTASERESADCGKIRALRCGAELSVPLLGLVDEARIF